MKTMGAIMNEIMVLISEINAKYPELYQFLDENPMTLPSKPDPQMNLKSMTAYRDSLIELLEHYAQTHGAQPV